MGLHAIHLVSQSYTAKQLAQRQCMQSLMSAKQSNLWTPSLPAKLSIKDPTDKKNKNDKKRFIYVHNLI